MFELQGAKKADKLKFIKKHKKLFQRVHDNHFFDDINMHKDSAEHKDDMLLSNLIRKHFDYSAKSNNRDLRRVFMKLYLVEVRDK